MKKKKKKKPEIFVDIKYHLSNLRFSIYDGVCSIEGPISKTEAKYTTKRIRMRYWYKGHDKHGTKNFAN